MGTKILTNKLETKVGVEFSNAKIDKFKPTFGDTKARHLELAFLLWCPTEFTNSQLPGSYVRQSILFLLLPPTNFEQD